MFSLEIGSKIADALQMPCFKALDMSETDNWSTDPFLDKFQMNSR